MKRIFSFIITILLVLNMGVFSVAFANEEMEIANSDAVTVVTGFDIMSYYNDGTFRPDETVTRAEMVAIICRLLYYEKQAKSSVGKTLFKDVSEEHWASGYINLIESLQIATGYGNGDFGPDDKVTYEQAVKMIITALGGGPLAIYEGGYPTGYLKLAAEEGILKNIECNVGDAVNRETVATLVFNAMEVRLAFHEVYIGGVENYPEQYGFIMDETILSLHLEMREWSGVLEKDGENFALKDAGCFEYKEGKLAKVEESLGEVDFSRIRNIDGFIGQEVNVYISMYEDETTGKHIAYAVTIKPKKNSPHGEFFLYIFYSIFKKY